MSATDVADAHKKQQQIIFDKYVHALQRSDTPFMVAVIWKHLLHDSEIALLSRRLYEKLAEFYQVRTKEVRKT